MQRPRNTAPSRVCVPDAADVLVSNPRHRISSHLLVTAWNEALYRTAEHRLSRAPACKRGDLGEVTTSSRRPAAGRTAPACHARGGQGGSGVEVLPRIEDHHAIPRPVRSGPHAVAAA